MVGVEGSSGVLDVEDTVGLMDFADVIGAVDMAEGIEGRDMEAAVYKSLYSLEVVDTQEELDKVLHPLILTSK